MTKRSISLLNNVNIMEKRCILLLNTCLIFSIGVLLGKTQKTARMLFPENNDLPEASLKRQ